MSKNSAVAAKSAKQTPKKPAGRSPAPAKSGSGGGFKAGPTAGAAAPNPALLGAGALAAILGGVALGGGKKKDKASRRAS